MRKRLFSATVLGLAMAVGAGCATPSAGIESPKAITAAKREKIKNGLTREQVIVILGEPETKLTLQDGESLFFKDVNLSSVWVQLDKNGKVTDKEWSE